MEYIDPIVKAVNDDTLTLVYDKVVDGTTGVTTLSIDPLIIRFSQDMIRTVSGDGSQFHNIEQFVDGVSVGADMVLTHQFPTLEVTIVDDKYAVSIDNRRLAALHMFAATLLPDRVKVVVNYISPEEVRRQHKIERFNPTPFGNYAIMFVNKGVADLVPPNSPHRPFKWHGDDCKVDFVVPGTTRTTPLRTFFWPGCNSLPHPLLACEVADLKDPRFRYIMDLALAIQTIPTIDDVMAPERLTLLVNHSRLPSLIHMLMAINHSLGALVYMDLIDTMMAVKIIASAGKSYTNALIHLINYMWTLSRAFGEDFSEAAYRGASPLELALTPLSTVDVIKTLVEEFKPSGSTVAPITSIQSLEAVTLDPNGVFYHTRRGSMGELWKSLLLTPFTGHEISAFEARRLGTPPIVLPLFNDMVDDVILAPIDE